MSTFLFNEFFRNHQNENDDIKLPSPILYKINKNADKILLNHTKLERFWCSNLFFPPSSLQRPWFDNLIKKMQSEQNVI